MDACPDCGNHDMRVRLLDGSPVFRCELCGGEFGDRAANEALFDAEEALRNGFEPLIWPLVRALNALPGFVVREARPGDEELSVLPFAEIGARNDDCLLQLENLAKTLLLGATSMTCHWVVEVEYRRHLAFVLKPRAPAAITARAVRDAQGDLERLRRQIERDQKLGWWQHPPEALNG